VKRTYIAIAAALAITVVAPFARAQDWPTKPVHILIGFGAGGGTDVATRILADGLTEALGQQFVVENRPGAGGTIAGGIAAKAPKDGYNLLAISMGHSVSAVMVKQVPYDAVKDFEPVGIFTNSAFVVVVPKNSPATDIKSLIEYVNKQPGKLEHLTVGLRSIYRRAFASAASINAQAVSSHTGEWLARRCADGFRRRAIIPFAGRWIPANCGSSPLLPRRAGRRFRMCRRSLRAA
jgi:tripartite-type tricarboxylate transporter receptor subunit TctC